MIYKFFHKKLNWVGLILVLKYVDGLISIKVCNGVFIIKYMQTIVCLGGVKKSKKLFTAPPISLILARIPLLCTLLPPSLTKLWGVHGWWKMCHMQGRASGPMFADDAWNMLCKTWVLGSYSQELFLARLFCWVHYWLWVLLGLEYSLVVVWLWRVIHLM